MLLLDYFNFLTDHHQFGNMVTKFDTKNDEMRACRVGTSYMIIIKYLNILMYIWCCI